MSDSSRYGDARFAGLLLPEPAGQAFETIGPPHRSSLEAAIEGHELRMDDPDAVVSRAIDDEVLEWLTRQTPAPITRRRH